MAEAYTSGDIFRFPSKTETFGNVNLEAMASGMAEVPCDLAVAHELIRRGHNGLLASAETGTAFMAAAWRGAVRTTPSGARHAKVTHVKPPCNSIGRNLSRRSIAFSGGAQGDTYPWSGTCCRAAW